MNTRRAGRTRTFGTRRVGTRHTGTRRFVRTRALGSGIAALTVAAALSACTISSGGFPPPPPPPPPDPITVEVHQTRTDVAAHTLQVAVTNASGATLAVESLVLHSDQFVAPARWPKERTTIAPGVTADLPVPLAAVNCEAGWSLPQIDLKYRVGDGPAQSITLEASDRLGQLAQISAVDCLAASVAEVVEITASTTPTIIAKNEPPAARLDLTLRPTGAIGTVTVRGVRSTTLLTVTAHPGQSEMQGVDAPGATPTASFPLTLTGSDAPVLLSLDIRPSRCDAHAIAEDKRGTIFPLDVVVGESSGEIAVAASDSVREDLYAFARAACALQPAPG